MKRKRLYLLSGIAGCGKSTFAKQRVATDGGVWISRDAIRFSILQEGEEYFSREDEVFDAFLSAIQGEINNPLATNIYVDATHLNKAARDKVLRRLNLDTLDEVNCVYFDVSADVAIKRNSNRTGRENVPEHVIRNMAAAHSFPSVYEKFNNILRIDEAGNIEEVPHLCLFS